MIRLRPSYVKACIRVALLKMVAWYVASLLFITMSLALFVSDNNFAGAVSLGAAIFFSCQAHDERREAKQRRKELPRRKTLPDRDSRDLVL